MKRALITLWAALVVAAPVAAYQMHANANAPRVAATWQQPVVTIDDSMVEMFAYEWERRGDTRNPMPELPFRLEFAPTAEADITVTWSDLVSDERIMGDALIETDGDKITSCTMRLDHLHAQRQTILHELGHCLGLVGHSGVDTLMAANTDPKIDRPTMADLRELRRLYR